MAVRSIISFAIVAHTQNIFEIIRQPTMTSQNILFNTQTVTPGKKNGEKHHLERIFQVVWPINYSVTNFFRLFLTKNGIFLKRRAAKFLFFRQWSNIIQRRVVFVMSFPLLYNIDNIQKMKFIQIFLWRMIESQIHAKYLLQILTYLFVHFVSLNAILRQGREIT